MGKLVVLKLGDGDCERGFSVTLQIGEDGDRPSTEIAGKLPPAPEIPFQYSRWQTAYRSLGWRTRLEAEAVQITNVSIIDDCHTAAQELCQSLNTWLHSPSFRLLREKLLEKLMLLDEVRVIVQTEDTWLQRLPWHLCDLFQRYPKAEIALSAPAYERHGQVASTHSGVKILAILGDSTGIDTQADRVLLECLPGASAKLLIEPQRQELNNQLWSQGWDILFFAGHSESQTIPRQSYAHEDTGRGRLPPLRSQPRAGVSPPPPTGIEPSVELPSLSEVSGAEPGKREQDYSGRLAINRRDSITINDLKFALQTAVAHGLKLAIFNSCDGLGLAHDLACLQIPQIVVMREPVPDRVAQEFLKHFLSAFAGGKSFYLAVREARERLQGLEAEFPCASWLPVIYQNPAEVPLTWQELHRRSQRDRLGLTVRSLRTVLMATLVTLLIGGMRHLGMLQALELQAFDRLNQLRPVEGPDPRLLVVKVTEADIQAQNQEPGQGSLSDPTLQRLLQKLEKYRPRTIGMDIYRSLPVLPNYSELEKQLRQSDRFFAVCKVSDPEVDESGVPPPPEIPKARLGFSDVLADRDDNVVRRQFIHFDPPLTSPCSTEYAFSLQLALHYLNTLGIKSKVTPAGELQVGDAIFHKLKARTGGYQTEENRGYQLLLNYRPYRSLADIAPQVTLGDILNDRIAPNLVKQLQDRIILIGVTAPSATDFWFTPYSPLQPPYQQQIPGVFLQAQMVSHILSAVLDGRSCFWVWSPWLEALWIWGWAVTGGILAWLWRSPLSLGLAIVAGLAVLSGLCFALLTQAGWVPLVASALALVATSGSVAIYLGDRSTSSS